VLTLGEQLVLIALDARKGVIRRSPALQFGLNAAGLADLLDAGRISLRRPGGAFGVTPIANAGATPLDDRILGTVLEQARAMPTGDRHPERCIQKWGEPSLRLYLDTLRERGILDWDKPKNKKARYGRFRLVDTGAAAEARARVDRVRTGAEPDARDHDLAGIVHGLALDAVVYSGIRGRSKRAALASATEKQRFAVLLQRAIPQLSGQRFIFDSSRDLAMAKSLVRGVTFDGHHGGYDGGGHGGGGHGGGGHGGGGGGHH
jgi:hypothetical protein